MIVGADGEGSGLSTSEEGRMANKIQYEIILYWSKEDQAYIAEAPELPGCAADGATYQEALANVEVVIQEWIETARELGRPVPEPRGRLMYA
jgi:predicted RNase H-like HicB family nuclease